MREKPCFSETNFSLSAYFFLLQSPYVVSEGLFQSRQDKSAMPTITGLPHFQDWEGRGGGQMLVCNY